MRGWRVRDSWRAPLVGVGLFGWLPTMLTVQALVAKDGLNSTNVAPGFIVLAAWFVVPFVAWVALCLPRWLREVGLPLERVQPDEHELEALRRRIAALERDLDIGGGR